MPKLKNWGGARPGSGRPIVGKEKRQITTIALEPVLLAALERYAKQAGLSRNEAVNRLLAGCLLSDNQESVPGVSVKQVSKGSSQSVQKPLIDKQNDNKANLPDWFTSEKPTFEELISDYAAAKFGQWLAENLPPLSPELQSQYKARWSSENSKLNCFRQYGPELIGAIKAGKIGLVPAPTLLTARKTDTELRKDLINLAGITF
jgi:hypothetical protein